MLFTPLGRIQLKTIIKRQPQHWSELLTVKQDGAYELVEPKPRLDGRDAPQRFLELVWLAVGVRLAATDVGISLEAPVLKLTNPELKQYVPRRSLVMGSPVLICPDVVFELVQMRYPELDLLVIPQANLPPGIKVYSLPSPFVAKLLEPYVLLNEPQPTFTIITNVLGRLDHLPLKELPPLPPHVSNAVKIDELTNGIMIRSANYADLVKFYLALKTSSSLSNLNFVSEFQGPQVLKIVKNYCWVLQELLDVFGATGLLNGGEIKQQDLVRVKTPDGELVRVLLSNVTYEKLTAWFGKQLVQGEFKVRLGQKVEIVGEHALLELAFKLLDPELDSKYSLVQRSLTHLVVQGIGKDRPYVDLLEIYFKLKSRFLINLVSEMDFPEFKFGRDALAEISKNSDFGGGRPAPEIMKIDGELYLAGNREAVRTIFDALPEDVKDDVVVEEMSPGVFGRKLLPRAATYVQLLLS